MIRSLYTAATGMHAQATNIDVVSNNLANVNTNGFKKSRADFQDLIYQVMQEPGAATSDTTNNPTGIQIGLGVKTAGVQKIFTQGDLTSTSNQLDVAIQGDGFFQVERNGVTAFTRSGALRLDSEGNIVTSDGYTIEGTTAIPANAQAITIAQDGTVTYRTPDSATPGGGGTITAVRFTNNAGLRSVGQNLYEETESSGSPTTGTFGEDGYGTLNQGFLESSNVSVVEQVVTMITAQRAYEAAGKGISTSDEMLSQAIQLKR